MISDALLLESLHLFFNNTYNRDKLLSVLSDDKCISLRSIDWFITNYSKKNNIYYLIYNDSDGNPSFDDEHNEYRNNMNVFHSYKSQLKAYSKKRFDPFCRWERITIPFDKNNDKHIQTTLGQLNFFKWALENKVISYIEEHYAIIEQDMNKRNSTSKRNAMPLNNSSTKTRKKREELSVSAVKSIKKEEVEIVVRFD